MSILVSAASIEIPFIFFLGLPAFSLFGIAQGFSISKKMDLIFLGGNKLKTKLSQSIANGISNIKVNIDLKKECLMTKSHLNTPLGYSK